MLVNKRTVLNEAYVREQECILFCTGKTRVISNWSDLFRSHMLRLCQFRVGALYFFKFLRHLLFTQLQIPRVMLSRMVSIVSKHERIPKWMCLSEKVDQGLVVCFTIDQMSGITLKMTN